MRFLVVVAPARAQAPTEASSRKGLQISQVFNPLAVSVSLANIWSKEGGGFRYLSAISVA
jgi:hypothetical protein